MICDRICEKGSMLHKFKIEFELSHAKSKSALETRFSVGDQDSGLVTRSAARVEMDKSSQVGRSSLQAGARRDVVKAHSVSNLSDGGGGRAPRPRRVGQGRRFQDRRNPTRQFSDGGVLRPPPSTPSSLGWGSFLTDHNPEAGPHINGREHSYSFPSRLEFSEILECYEKRPDMIVRDKIKAFIQLKESACPPPPQ